MLFEQRDELIVHRFDFCLAPRGMGERVDLGAQQMLEIRQLRAGHSRPVLGEDSCGDCTGFLDARQALTPRAEGRQFAKARRQSGSNWRALGTANSLKDHD